MSMVKAQRSLGRIISKLDKQVVVMYPCQSQVVVFGAMCGEGYWGASEFSREEHCGHRADGSRRRGAVSVPHTRMLDEANKLIPQKGKQGRAAQ